MRYQMNFIITLINFSVEPGENAKNLRDIKSYMGISYSIMDLKGMILIINLGGGMV